MQSKNFVARYGKNLFLEDIEKAILCFSSATAKKLQSLYKGERIHSLGACWDIYTKNKSLVVSQFGVGSPSALLQFEYLKAFKFPLVFSLGSIASFDKHLNLGQQLFIQQAYEESFPSLYVKNTSKKQNSKNVEKSEKRIEKHLIKNPHKAESEKLIKKLSLLPITSVSCDTPYKITKKKLSILHLS